MTNAITSPERRQDGYYDCVFSIFESYHHPIILVEDGAMRWMGLRMCSEEVRKELPLHSNDQWKCYYIVAES